MSARAWTVANSIMLLMFLFSAVVQFNDPDPLPWMAIYIAAAVVCGLEIRRKTPMWAPLLLAVLALAWSGYIATRARDVPIIALFAEWEMRNIRVEEAREMYGLAIAGIWMLAILGVRWARGKAVGPAT